MGGDRVILSSKVFFKPRRGRSEIVDGRTGEAVAARCTAPNPALMQALVQAEFWRTELAKHPTKSLLEITTEHGANPGYVRRLLNAAYLAPSIKRAVFQGTHPGRLQVQDLIAPRSLDWRVQMSELGFDESLSPA